MGVLDHENIFTCKNKTRKFPDLWYTEHVHVPATSTPQKKTSRRMQTITTSPMTVPTAIPAMAPGDKPGRAVVTGVVAVGEESILCHLPWCITCTGSQKNGTK